ncbi:MAG: hypothetical protein NW223_11040 [Hyphomicrobiaceae bacterium]|nr:hypothetical protein [Hyphomicrobiaceae bacterium]
MTGLGLCAAVVASVLLAGCANSQPFATGFAGPAQAAEFEQDPAQKSMASKVLSAIALERVTGAKPDPTRLGER